MTTVTSQERFKTDKGVFDEFTHRNLFELESRGVFDKLLSPYKIGKESNVFIAQRKNKKCIVKIYRLQNCDFKRMYEYIRVDPRYEYLMKRRREIIFAWTQREFKNLLRAKKAGINSPVAHTFRDNILVESMIGDEEPALMLKDQHPKNLQKFFQKVIEQMKKLYKAGLIHGDLSSFNILNYKEEPYFIDFSQGTLVKSPNTEELLRRDIINILAFFKKLKIHANPEEIFKTITNTK